MRDSFIIGVAGGSGSGKTRLASRMAAALGEEWCAVLSQDDYYCDLPVARHAPADVNFDNPDAIDFSLLASDLGALQRGESVFPPHYDFATHARLGRRHEAVAPRTIILLDGILILAAAELRGLFASSLYLRCPTDLRYRRRLARDTHERGRTPLCVRRQFDEQVEPMHQTFVAPSAVHADAVFDQDALLSGRAEAWLHARCEALLES
ncbi:MAG: uridine kinase [Pseudomonadota bacterium]